MEAVAIELVVPGQLFYHPAHGEHGTRTLATDDVPVDRKCMKIGCSHPLISVRAVDYDDSVWNSDRFDFNKFNIVHDNTAFVFVDGSPHDRFDIFVLKPGEQVHVVPTEEEK